MPNLKDYLLPNPDENRDENQLGTLKYPRNMHAQTLCAVAAAHPGGRWTALHESGPLPESSLAPTHHALNPRRSQPLVLK